MAHNINFNPLTGQHSFFSVKEKAWHGLGQIVQEYPTSTEAIKQAGLDYRVIKSPVYTRCGDLAIGEDGTVREPDILVPDAYATLRSDTREVFGVVGKDYNVVQNSEAFNFFDAIVGGDDGILYETAGALGKGETIFITAKLPGYIRVGNGDDVTEKYIFLTTSHDGSGSITAAFTPIRIVCQNTLNAAMRSMSNVVRIRHTANAGQRLKDAHKVMGIADNMSTELEGVFNAWSKVHISDRELHRLIQLALCPNRETYDLLRKGAADELSTVFKNSVDNAFSYAMMSDSQQMDTTKGTVFGAYNAITGFYQNVKDFKSPELKAKSILFGGTASQRTQKAFDLCTGVAEGGADILNLN